MELMALTTFLFMGFSLGMVHALDPDHIAAVSGLSASETEQHTWRSMRFGLQWSLGHGSALLIIALVVFLAGQAIPVHLSEVAERSVAFVLIAIGALALWRLWQGGDAPGLSARFGAPAVGLLHGTAGSAPLLALIPISQIGQPIVGMFYVLFFSAGVVLAMTALGGAFAQSLRTLKRIDGRISALLQGLMALFSLILGFYLAFQG